MGDLSVIFFYFFKKKIMFMCISSQMGLYHPPDGVTNLKYKLLCFLTPNKIIF